MNIWVSTASGDHAEDIGGLSLLNGSSNGEACQSGGEESLGEHVDEVVGGWWLVVE